MGWIINYYSESLVKEIIKFPVAIQARYLKLAERLIIYGPHLGFPYTRPVGHGLFELRLKSIEGIGRFFYCVLHDREIMMLHTVVNRLKSYRGGFYNSRLNKIGFMRARISNPWRNQVRFRCKATRINKVQISPSNEWMSAKKRMMSVKERMMSVKNG